MPNPGCFCRMHWICIGTTVCPASSVQHPRNLFDQHGMFDVREMRGAALQRAASNSAMQLAVRPRIMPYLPPSLPPMQQDALLPTVPARACS